jgi:hypothetical protein
MRYLFTTFLAAGIVLAGQSGSSNTQTLVPDLNGGFVASNPTYSSTKSPGASSQTEYMMGINGQLVPRESTEEKVTMREGGVKVIERMVRRYDQNGQLAGSEKVVIEEKKSGNTVTTTSTLYRGDLNGNLAPAERTQSQAVTQGQITRTESTVERSGFDGRFAVAERVSATVVQKSKETQEATTSRMRLDTNGNFYEAVREVSEKTAAADGRVTENKTQYVGGALFEQSVSRTVPGPGGSATTTVDVFTTEVPGVTADPTGRLALKVALKEQQQIVVQPTGGKGGPVTQTVTSRRPTVNEPNRLGPAQVLSQSVCKGNCTP